MEEDWLGLGVVTKEHVKHLSQEPANVATHPHYCDDAAINVRTLRKFSLGGHSSSHSKTSLACFPPSTAALRHILLS